jgi:hypothetical protein
MQYPQPVDPKSGIGDAAGRRQNVWSRIAARLGAHRMLPTFGMWSGGLLMNG